MNIITLLWIIFGVVFGLSVCHIAQYRIQTGSKVLYRQTVAWMIILIIDWNITWIWSIASLCMWCTDPISNEPLRGFFYNQKFEPAWHEFCISSYNEFLWASLFFYKKVLIILLLYLFIKFFCCSWFWISLLLCWLFYCFLFWFTCWCGRLFWRIFV